ncbi:hypothetical protein CJF42_24320 [Pseudoalteromonas sp. NBT06-2]|uniref:hypothetical protein n=1 Tax=Pseudoalteromonas sp. NBT06-2 TaxID=2025950 RepID=UPI000BA50532|nr:hypothetical protein [Pseudoalteromonas sp. NBT06-2]PAJ71875.1 hypothetical protein CJF42_24320 [Pseudoalteromonas sp. NBT06-2]
MKFYIQNSDDDFYLGFCEFEQPLYFRSRAEAFVFCIEYANGRDFDVIDVDDSNWQELFESGAFDYDPTV